MLMASLDLWLKQKKERKTLAEKTAVLYVGVKNALGIQPD